MPEARIDHGTAACKADMLRTNVAKDATQLLNYQVAVLSLCFCIDVKSRFSHDAARMASFFTGS